MFPTCTWVHMRSRRSSRRSQRLVERVEPELVVASGDLAHRGRRGQLERAAALLRSLGPPVLAVPGNHDLPYTPARFIRPWAEFERSLGDDRADGLVAGPPRRRAQLGAAVPAPGRRAEPQRSSSGRRNGSPRAEDSALRVVVLHHHLIGAPWRAARKRPVARRNHVLARARRRRRRPDPRGTHPPGRGERAARVRGRRRRGAHRGVAIAPGLGQPRPQRLGEARGLHVYEADADAIVVRHTLVAATGRSAPSAASALARSCLAPGRSGRCW